MPNARDAHGSTFHRILALGPTGSGKTTQLLTLPKPVFVYLFDPNALESLKGFDVTYEAFMPSTVPMSAGSLAKDKPKDKSQIRSSDVYRTWEQDFETKLESGFFDDFKTVALDSGTTFLDLIMDRVLTLNGRYGQWPQQDDYGPQMIAFTNVMRTLTALQKTVYVTGHLMVDKDELTQKVFRQPLMTGRLREKMPLLFSDVLATGVQSDKDGKPVYTIQTVPDSMTPVIRTSIKGLDKFEDVTLDFTQPLEGQGLGGLLKWEQAALKTQPNKE